MLYENPGFDCQHAIVAKKNSLLGKKTLSRTSFISPIWEEEEKILSYKLTMPVKAADSNKLCCFDFQYLASCFLFGPGFLFFPEEHWDIIFCEKMKLPSLWLDCELVNVAWWLLGAVIMVLFLVLFFFYATLENIRRIPSSWHKEPAKVQINLNFLEGCPHFFPLPLSVSR